MPSHNESPPGGQAFFPFGGTYAPVAKATEVPRSEWAADMARMRELGFTIMRAFVAWDRIEPVEGQRDFSGLDYIFELAERNGIWVMLNIGGVFDNLVGIYPPQWLAREYQCQPFIENPGAAPGYVGVRRKVCFDDPIYRTKAEEFLTAIVRRYVDSPRLHSWVIWNEPHWSGCYCAHTLAKFRAWLQGKYRDVQALNSIWSSEFPIRYRTWDEVEAPTGVGFLEGGYAAWLDWQAFCQDNLAATMAWVAAIVKRWDPRDRPTTTNLTPGDTLSAAVNARTNLWRIGEVVDVLGYSNYGYREPRADVLAARLDRLRSASTAPGKAFWIIETEAGPVLWVHGNLPHYTPTRRRILRHWQAIGHGAKAILCWLYRTRITDSQAGEFGLLAWDGSITERARATGELSRLLQKHASLFIDCEYRAEVAILAGHSTLRQGAAEGYEGVQSEEKNYWQRSWLGAHKLLWDLKLAADFVEDRDVIAGNLARYKLLLLPFRPNISDAVGKGLAYYVSRGGRIIAEFPLGFKDDQGILRYLAPGAELASVFGCSAVDAFPAQDEELRLATGLAQGGATLPVYIFQQELRPEAAAQVLGTYPSGAAALVANRHGQGETLLAGTLLFAAYAEVGTQAVRHLVASWIDKAGVGRDVQLSASGGDDMLPGIELCQLTGQADRLLIVLNHNQASVEVNLRVRHTAGSLRLTDLIHDRDLSAVAEGDWQSVSLALDPEGVAVIRVS